MSRPETTSVRGLNTLRCQRAATAIAGSTQIASGCVAMPKPAQAHAANSARRSPSRANTTLPISAPTMSSPERVWELANAAPCQTTLPKANVSAAASAASVPAPKAEERSTTQATVRAVQSAENAFIRHATVPIATACEKIPSGERVGWKSRRVRDAENVGNGLVLGRIPGTGLFG